MTAGSRYKSDPRRVQGKTDLAEILGNINQRIRTSETAFRVGHTAIEDGDLVVRNGDIVVSETDGTEVLRMIHGAVPELRFRPLGIDDDRFAAVWGQDYTTDLGGGFGSIVTTALNLGIYDSAIPEDHVLDGGEVRILPDGVIVDYQPNNGDEQVYISLNAYSRVDPFKEIITIRGRWDDQFDFDDHAAMSVGSVDIGAGFGGFTWNYVQTYATKIAPIIGLVNTAGLLTSWNISAMNTSNFSVVWSGVLAKTMNFWNPRL